jgi:hypothetical protein
MDSQFAPRVLARPLHARVVNVIGAVADDTKVAVSGERRWDEAAGLSLDVVA